MTIVEIRWQWHEQLSTRVMKLSFILVPLHVCVMFFTITFDSVFFLHVCAMHLCLFQLHMSCIFCFFTCLCNVSYYHSSCECRLFAKFLQNKLPYWHWCYWGDLVKKKREKLNQSSLLNKNMYQSSVIHLHHFFLYLHISRFVKFKVRHEMSSV